ncbi:MAG TPA: arginine deiminase family protein [Anaerolineales bacterium]|jgi:dimethylargininase|nr:arginine deiminase family protein [Anaerolineales bacterium]
MTIAITREISPRFAECEITHIERTPIDLALARLQHQSYVNVLRRLGCDVVELPAEPDLPDSVFVEDTAFILPDVAVITRPGADSRKPETESIIRALSPLIRLIHVQEPATVDGGDVLVLGKQIYVGLSTRSNPEAIDQLNRRLGDHGYTVRGIELHDCLHLKSAVTRVDDQTLLINENWVGASCFENFDLIQIDPSEPYAANCLPIGTSVIFPSVFPKTHALLEQRGYNVVTLDVSELAKAEGAVTCCSLIIP